MKTKYQNLSRIRNFKASLPKLTDRELRTSEGAYARELKSLVRKLVVHPYQEALQELPDRLAPTPRREDGLFEILGLGAAALSVATLLGGLVVRAFNRMARRVVKKTTPFDEGVVDVVAEARKANVELMDKLHRNYSAGVRAVLEDPQVLSKPIAEITRELKERADITERHAELIARDQV